MILVLGYSSESTVQHVLERLRHNSVAFDFLDFGTLRECRQLQVSGNSEDLFLKLDDSEFDFCKYSAFYCRQYHADLGTPQRNRALEHILGWVASYLESTEATVVNRPSAGMLNSRKLDQLTDLQGCGFDVPETLVTESLEVAQSIVKPNGLWTSKSCSAIKTKATIVDVELMRRLPLLKFAPSTFQRVIGGFDVRLHVVGHHLIPLKIESSEFDYRFRGEGNGNKFSSDIQIPPAVEIACRRYCDQEGLVFAGFDFKVDAERGWVVLEANPMPGFDYFDRQEALSGAIGDALCDVLTRKPVRRSRVPSPQPLIDAMRRPTLSPFR
jgi:hypothetical protein